MEFVTGRRRSQICAWVVITCNTPLQCSINSTAGAPDRWCFSGASRGISNNDNNTRHIWYTVSNETIEFKTTIETAKKNVKENEREDRHAPAAPISDITIYITVSVLITVHYKCRTIHLKRNVSFYMGQCSLTYFTLYDIHNVHLGPGSHQSN